MTLVIGGPVSNDIPFPQACKVYLKLDFDGFPLDFKQMPYFSLYGTSLGVNHIHRCYMRSTWQQSAKKSKC